MYNIYDELNKVIDYIEEHILDEIKMEKLVKIAGLNVNVLKSVFSCLAGVTINEYIRLRRLSLSVNDILNGESITSIAYKYLYNSPSSYNRAFKCYEGISPRELKNNSKELKLYNKIVFRESVRDYNIDYKIYRNKEFTLYGISKEINYDDRVKDITSFWKEVKKEYTSFNENIRYGFLKNKKTYYCLLDKMFLNSKKIVIPKTNFFVIKIFDFESKNIILNINKGVKEYIKSLNYTISNSPIIEMYYKDYIELLIPII